MKRKRKKSRSLWIDSSTKMIHKIFKELKEYHPPKPLAFLFLVIPILIAISRMIYLDNDFWFLVNTGKYIVNHGFPTIEPFTIHTNFSFVVQQWLTDVIYYYIHLFLGGWGIVFFTFLQFLVILFLCYKLCLLVSENRVHLSILLTTIMSFLLSLVFVRSRPQMFDFIILLSLFYCLELYIRKKNKKYLYPLPLFSLALINLHASSWLLLFVLSLPYIINSYKFKILCFESEGYPKRPLYITTIVMFLVGFINPYGIKAMTYLLTSYGNHYINILVNEMRYPRINTPLGCTIYLSIFLILLCHLLSKKPNIKIRYFLLFLGTTFLALTSIKGFSFFLIASIFPLGETLKEKFRVYQEEYHYSKEFKMKYIMIVGVIIFLLVGVCLFLKKDFYQTEISDTIKFLETNEKESKQQVRIYTNYDDGAFAEYQGWQVYLDPRAEIFLKENNHKKDIIKEYYELQTGKQEIEKFLTTYQFDYLIINKEDYLYKSYLNTEKNTSYQKIYTEKKETTHYLYRRVEGKND